MVFERPMARPAPGDGAGQEHGSPALSRAPDTSRRDLGGRRHDQLKGVLKSLSGVEEQDILRPCPYIYRENPHRADMIAPVFFPPVLSKLLLSLPATTPLALTLLVALARPGRAQEPREQKKIPR